VAVHFPAIDGVVPKEHPKVMADEPSNLVLEHLRAIRGDVADIKESVRNLQVRVTSIEENMAAMNRRFDRMERDVEHIKRRLDLVDA
jgi:predicted  nucleic acid-binding Zn-ribbon protein